ncbi:MAG: MFS transporter, partial [Deltaproteobacteria bacterium]|nr:MFS transporter [Deltaproteobacteria bacterium]
MPNRLFSSRFAAVTGTNFCLFLIVTTWCFLPLFIVELGGNEVDAGIVMGAMGITSLGSLPILAPLIDRYGRKIFIAFGILAAGLSNAGFLFFSDYSALMIAVRLVQGLAFAACFNGCATAVVDALPPERRVQGIGLFGISGSLATAVGPYIGETVILNWGYNAYFSLLVGFGLVGFVPAMIVKDAPRQINAARLQGFFTTALSGGHLSMMVIAAIFGAAFSAMQTFFPLLAKSLGLQAGIFFVCYGSCLVGVRLFLGRLADEMNRERLIFFCLIVFGIALAITSQITQLYQTVIIGMLFGITQGLSYPAMMARMVDRASEHNRAIVVALFTGSFGVGIHLSAVLWGTLANWKGLPFMF